jgi:AcrR family transcriptional regulator
LRVKTEEKRQAIVANARQAFRKKGFVAASMAEISASLGGSKGTLYNYFTSKEELFAAVIVEMAKSNGEGPVSELEQAREIKAALRTFAHELVRLFCSPELIDFRRMHIAEGGRPGLGKLVYDNGPKLFHQRVAAVFAAQVRAGSFRDVDPWQAALHLVGLCKVGLADNLLEGVVDHVSEEEIAATADAAADVFLRAYAVEPPSAGRTRVKRKGRSKLRNRGSK